MDVMELFENPPETQIYIMDSHRPTHVLNVYNESKQVGANYNYVLVLPKKAHFCGCQLLSIQSIVNHNLKSNLPPLNCTIQVHIVNPPNDGEVVPAFDEIFREEVRLLTISSFAFKMLSRVSNLEF